MIAATPFRKRLETISDDSVFRDVIRQASWEANHRFVTGRLEEIKDILRLRLGVQLGSENVIMPEGSVFEVSSGKSKIEQNFVQGKEALQIINYGQAAACFEASAHKSTGINQDIANNYRAYSLSKLGEPLRARLILSPLCKSKIIFPSAYWNLACCMSAEQKAEQLAILASGIYNAPHPFLLKGTVYLATLVGHKLLADWLLWLPLTEALLLSYNLRYDQMSSAAKEIGMLRLGAYVFGGEPEVPDPLDYAIPRYKVKSFANALFERQRHAEVMDFWLRCRSRIGQNRYGFWQMKADYLDQFGRRKRAINAFRSELHCRLNLLASAPQLQTNSRFLSATRMRVGIYLRRCLSPDLHNQGQAICHVLARFEECYAIRFLPQSPKMLEHFCNNGRPPSDAAEPHGISPTS